MHGETIDNNAAGDEQVVHKNDDKGEGKSRAVLPETDAQVVQTECLYLSACNV